MHVYKSNGGCPALTRMDELRAAVLFIGRESWTFERTAGRIGSTCGTSAANTEDACTLGNGALSSDWPSERYPVKEREEVIRPRYYYMRRSESQFSRILAVQNPFYSRGYQCDSRASQGLCIQSLSLFFFFFFLSFSGSEYGETAGLPSLVEVRI